MMIVCGTVTLRPAPQSWEHSGLPTGSDGTHCAHEMDWSSPSAYHGPHPPPSPVSGSTWTSWQSKQGSGAASPGPHPPPSPCQWQQDQQKAATKTPEEKSSHARRREKEQAATKTPEEKSRHTSSESEEFWRSSCRSHAQRREKKKALERNKKKKALEQLRRDQATITSLLAEPKYRKPLQRPRPRQIHGTAAKAPGWAHGRVKQHHKCATGAC